MATVAPSSAILASTATTVTYEAVTWANMATGDTITRIEPGTTRGVAGCVTFTGTFGGATVTLQGSNDGTNWFNLLQNGTAIAATAAALFDFSTAARYLRPALTGGTGDSVTAILMLRG
jgi:hypothetical protein